MAARTHLANGVTNGQKFSQKTTSAGLPAFMTPNGQCVQLTPQTPPSVQFFARSVGVAHIEQGNAVTERSSKVDVAKAIASPLTKGSSS